METAVASLQKAIELAKKYDASTNKRVTMLQSYTSAIEEDIQFVLSFKENKPWDKAVADVLAEARFVRRELERQILEMQAAAPPAQAQATQSSTGGNIIDKVATAMLLPQVKMPTFDGDPARFRLFYDTFVDTVLKNTNISDMTKWVHLKNNLQGKALNLISEIPETPKTLEIALKLLHETYGSEEKAITDLYQRLQQIPTATMAAESLRMTYVKVEGLLLTLQEYAQDTDNNSYLRSVVFGKFPPDVVFTITNGAKVSLQQFREKLSAYVISRESTYDQMVYTATPAPPTASRSAPAGARQRPSSRSAPTTPQRTPRCIFCEQDHWSDECTTFVTLEQRKQKVAGRCHKCLRLAHPNTNCHTDRRCFHCDAFDHNRALCPKKTSKAAPLFAVLTVPPTSISSATSVETSAVPVKQHGAYWTLRAEITSNKVKQKKTARVFLDPGCKSAMVTKRIADNMGLRKVVTSKQELFGLNNTPLAAGYTTKETLTVHGRDGQKVDIEPIVVDHITDDLPAPNVDEFREKYPQYSHLYIPPTGQGEEVDILLGSDALLQILKLGGGIEISEQHQLLSTIFGHVIVTSEKSKIKSPLAAMFVQPEQEIKLMYDLDALGLRYIEESDEAEEVEAIRKFYETIRFIEERYEVAWPWRYYPPLLDTNYGLAIGRLRSLYKQLKNKPEVLLEYHRVIMEQVSKGIAEAVVDKWPKKTPVHYLPHHPVVKQDSSTAVRPVYDASTSGVAKGSSLNENMLKGTKWLTDLVGVLLRFREDKTALTADIERAFHQIGIREANRDVVRFVWLKDPLKEPTQDNLQIYRFTRVAFGIVSSPFLLNATIHFHAEHHPNEYTPTVLRNLYADNLVTTLAPEIDSIKFYEKTKEFFQSMGMNLRQWSTNDAWLRHRLDEADRVTEEIQPILGMRWNLNEDTLRLKTPNFKSLPHGRITKRIVLSQAAAVYDPLGWAAPITLTAKIFIRKVWETGAKWDQNLLQEIHDQWTPILQQLQQVDRVQQRRVMFPDIASTVPATTELHVFVDASIEAYAAVVYAVKRTDNYTQMTFIAAKNQLTPDTKLTVPRLELLAVLAGCRYSRFILQALQWDDVKLYVWSDSKCVLAWIQSGRLQPPIIQRQLAEIKKQKVTQFCYVPTDMNRADIATRGATYQNLQEMEWWSPPEWLHDTANWPQQTPLPEATPYVVQHQPVLFISAQQRRQREKESENKENSPCNIDINDYSSMLKLIRQTVAGLKFLNSFKVRQLAYKEQESDYVAARRYWVRWDQQRVFHEAKNKPTNQPFTIRNIRVFVDNQGIIRCYSRTVGDVLPEHRLYPVLLVPGSKLTQLIVLNAHELNCHAGTAHTLAAVRKIYWLPQGRRQVYSIITQACYKCKRQTASTYPNPPPAPLPEFRVTRSTRPFEGTALDICGPFAVRATTTNNQAKQKRWIILFTCTRIRAVHLEVLDNLTTNEILDSFRRFIARRGTPRILLSDNAPQFHALNGIFQKLWHTVAIEPSIVDYIAKNEIQWKFLPPESPWMGGVHERIVQMVKTCIERTYGDRVLTERQFGTSVIEIEGIINSRPLTYVDQHIESKIITPNDFLVTKFQAIPLDAVQLPHEDPILHLWKSSQAYLDEFWLDWSRLYIAELRERDDKLKNKRRNAVTKPKQGDIVLISEPEKKRSSWRLAVIERLIHSADGEIRSAQLRLPDTKHGVTHTGPEEQIRVVKPITKLAPLGIQTDLPGVDDAQLTTDRAAIILKVPEGVGSDGYSSQRVDEPQMVSDQVGGQEAAAEANDGENPSGEVETIGSQLSTTASETVEEEIQLDVSDWGDDDDSDDENANERFQMAEDHSNPS